MTTSEKPAIYRVSEFLARPEKDVVHLLKEGRLFRAMVDEYSRRGMTVSPKLKNTVQHLVRDLEAALQSAAVPSQENGTAPGVGVDGTGAASAGAPSQSRSFDTEGTTTIMFTDIVASSALTQRLGDRVSRELFSEHDRLVRRVMAAHDGHEVKAMGDGFMIAFASAKRGVACAAAIQRELAALSLEHDEVPQVRIGLSVGEPIKEEGDLFGLSVIKAARVSASAGAGQVLVSELVYRLVVSSGDFRFSSVESVEMKGIDGTQKLYELCWRDDSGSAHGSEE